ncbi:hypothetical protein PHYSODRAFT_517659 [Phytophthora sojae]|uniref:BED-type domain-containing protein n=1 Tax=Phytophthora sojae (strain P6497) TaxID=1094619 RepID=G4ZW62_PHYSP|nr:hypothetical protein PHYSODRAFT_517659 [Phytophthora sojae]EGZ12344.1 hypothetical protein PHYSODRAFT_517659 [Phytophthora sojae]|eukprot:XP_009532677.1 hypothetical protein PHYSODRAFT_517659 [Phytophthora sojae]
MRKLPSSASAGNLRQLVDSVVVASNTSEYSSNGSSTSMPSSGSARPGPSGAEDRGGKKSLAYLHTKPHRNLQDKLGKSYERRICRYCDVIFSFRGGTTSAALRHLKKAHPEKLVLSGDSSDAQRASTVVTTRGSSSRTGANPPQVVEEQTVASSTASEGETDENRNTDANTMGESRVNDLDEDDTSVMFETETPTPTIDQGRATSKRKRGDDDYSAAGVTAPSSSSLGDVLGEAQPGSSSKLTASQTAIVHFLQHYANELPQPAMRLRLAKHLTRNVGEAEMYNVLDPATQLEYVREFAQLPPPQRAYSSK